MSDAPEQIYTNKSATVIITPPAIPLQKTDIAWCRAERIKELEAKLEEVFQMYVDANEFRLELEAKLGRAALEGLEGQDSECQATDPFDR